MIMDIIKIPWRYESSEDSCLYGCHYALDLSYIPRYYYKIVEMWDGVVSELIVGTPTYPDPQGMWDEMSEDWFYPIAYRPFIPVQDLLDRYSHITSTYLVVPGVNLMCSEGGAHSQVVGINDWLTTTLGRTHGGMSRSYTLHEISCKIADIPIVSTHKSPDLFDLYNTIVDNGPEDIYQRIASIGESYLVDILHMLQLQRYRLSPVLIEVLRGNHRINTNGYGYPFSRLKSLLGQGFGRVSSTLLEGYSTTLLPPPLYPPDGSQSSSFLMYKLMDMVWCSPYTDLSAELVQGTLNIAYAINRYLPILGSDYEHQLTAVMKEQGVRKIHYDIIGNLAAEFNDGQCINTEYITPLLASPALVPSIPF